MTVRTPQKLPDGQYYNYKQNQRPDKRKGMEEYKRLAGLVAKKKTIGKKSVIEEIIDNQPNPEAP